MKDSHNILYRLDARLVASLLVVLLGGLIAIGALLYQTASNKLVGSQQASLELQARTLAQYSLDSLWSDDPSWLDKQVANLQQSDNRYAYIAIVYPSGEIRAHSEVNRKPQKMMTISYMTEGSHRKGRYLEREINEFIYPVFHQDKLLANVHLAYYADTLSIVGSQNFWQVLLACTISLLALAVISFLICTNFSRGVQQLTCSLAKSTPENRYRNPELEKRRDEIGALARAWRKVSDDMGSKYNEMDMCLKNNKSIIDSFGDGIIIFDQQGIVESINVTAEHIFGYSHDELVGSHVMGLLPESKRLKHYSYLKRYLQNRVTSLSGAKQDIEGLRKDGSVIPLELLMGQLSDSERLLTVATVKDMTRRHEYEQALLMSKVAAEEGNRVKTEFLAMMSHELRTPMNAIMGTIDLLDSDKLSEEQKQYIQIAKAASSDLLALLDSVLDFPSLDTGQIELDNVEIDFRKMLVLLVNTYTSCIKTNDVSLIADVEANVESYYMGDATRIRKVIGHLLNNAIKFTEAGGIGVNISIAEQSEDTAIIRVEVTDTGIGVDARDYSRIFDLFTQVDSSSTRKHGGIGIGLAICKRKIEIMGGKIGVISEPGTGSTFWFQLELHRASKPTSHDQPQAIA